MPTCNRRGCDSLAVFVPRLLLRRSDGIPERKALIDCPVCSIHAEYDLDLFLTDKIWRQIITQMIRKGDPLPQRELTVLEFEGLIP